MSRCARCGPWLLALVGCAGPQSALEPAGFEAHEVAGLFWLMLTVAGVIWLLVIGTAVYATRINPERHSERGARRLIVIGGIVLPTLMLAGLLVYGLRLMPVLRAPGHGLRIEVAGEQWWWRVRYWPQGAAHPIESANEVRLPLGQRVELILTSPDVIHSFWVPSLGGKVDMIPGRANRLVLEPTRTGTFRGACAEFCGTSHALMAFTAVVMEEDAFDEWLRREGGAAPPPGGGSAAAGEAAFQAAGCGACHTVRGTEAAGVIGPDLTHLGGRQSLAAGILPNDQASLVRWIAATETVKPGSRMPPFGMLPETDIAAIATWLGSLR